MTKKEEIIFVDNKGNPFKQYHKIIHTYKTIYDVVYGNLKDGRRAIKIDNKWYMEDDNTIAFIQRHKENEEFKKKLTDKIKELGAEEIDISNL